MALGRSGLWQALRQSHLQLPHSTMFMPSILLMRILALSAQLGLSFLLLGILTSFYNLLSIRYTARYCVLKQAALLVQPALNSTQIGNLSRVQSYLSGDAA